MKLECQYLFKKKKKSSRKIFEIDVNGEIEMIDNIQLIL